MSSHLRAVDQREFTRACARFATGVTIASVRDGAGTPHGLTVNSFTSVSLEPPLILICLGHAVTVIDYFKDAAHFGISILSEEQRPMSDRFAEKGHDRFDGIPWHPGATGVPLLTGAVATIECAPVHRFTAGDHDIFVGEVLHTQVRDGARPLIYFASRYRHLG
jgi:flavin reductase (DIM6/NTAB) family NADH-FMN oxidoreductase RutF